MKLNAIENQIKKEFENETKMKLKAKLKIKLKNIENVKKCNRMCNWKWY